ncbi:MAG: cell envelope biogenesis protein OmpA [Maribacter sp.]|nr:cell envelope biogenesis protein OmpA [Maribacter sp.]
MKNAIIYNVTLGCIITFLSYSVSAQNSNQIETHKRVDQYLELKNLGYTDREVFEDLGNANFLTQNYATAVFWYKKLMDSYEEGTLSASYQERYQYALKQTGPTGVSSTSNEKDWLASVRSDYQLNKIPMENTANEFLADNMNEVDLTRQNDQFPEDQIAVTADGKTAYFSKAITIKPMYGLFSKKQLVYKVFKAENVHGEWKNIQEITLGPKYYSAKQPAISADGKRLFFASNMPGTFGKFDIYVAELDGRGNFGVPKNLGKKINTDKNDLYPQIVGGNSLFFASDGHKGYGGLDIYLAQVDRKKVSQSINLGGTINSDKDDFSISFTEKGMGYVLSNRGSDKQSVQRVAFTFSKGQNMASEEKKGYNILEAFNTDGKVDYTTSVFEND